MDSINYLDGMRQKSISFHRMIFLGGIAGKMATSRQPTIFFLKGHYQQTSVTLMHCKECTRYGHSNTDLSDCLASTRCSPVHMQCLYKWRLIMSSVAESLQTAISSPPLPVWQHQQRISALLFGSKWPDFQFHWAAGAVSVLPSFSRGRCTGHHITICIAVNESDFTTLLQKVYSYLHIYIGNVRRFQNPVPQSTV